jgi:putative peptide zinc metalloprotease protein
VSDPLLSPSWYRVASLRPRLRKQARFHRHVYRGQVWYVVQDRASGRCHRLTPSAYQIVGLMDGRRTTQELWEAAGTRLGDEGPTQDETIRLLGLLHAADVLRCDVSPDVEELFRRTRRRKEREGWQRLTSPLSLKLPLVDPDAFLARWVPVVAPLFSRGGAVACAVPIAVALVFAAVNADEIAAAGPSRLLEARNLLLLWLVYPLVKGLHELGHAAATKVWGGEVHEMGIMFLVLVPVPYVDASAASAFPEKGRRIVVGAAGILVELVLASLALLVWLAVEPGLVRDLAYAVMWIGGASTLFFNGNPLLRFDGYYVLADAVEIPNLKTRSTEYLAYLVLNRLFGVESARHPVSAPREAAWLAVYGVTSFLYRLVVVFGIALFISQKFFVLGTLLAVSVVTTSVVVPLLRQTAFLLTSPRLGAQRPRAIATSAGLAAAAAVLIFLAPTPVFTTTQGVVWPPERSQVRAGADAFVSRLLVEPGTRVEAGQPLVLTRDATLEADAAVLEGKLRELRTRYHAERRTHRGRAQILADKIAGVETALARARERVGDSGLGDGSYRAHGTGGGDSGRRGPGAQPHAGRAGAARQSGGGGTGGQRAPGGSRRQRSPPHARTGFGRRRPLRRRPDRCVRSPGAREGLPVRPRPPRRHGLEPDRDACVRALRPRVGAPRRASRTRRPASVPEARRCLRKRCARAPRGGRIRSGAMPPRVRSSAHSRVSGATGSGGGPAGARRSGASPTGSRSRVPVSRPTTTPAWHCARGSSGVASPGRDSPIRS